jgi:hypothetical protein
MIRIERRDFYWNQQRKKKRKFHCKPTKLQRIESVPLILLILIISCHAFLIHDISSKSMLRVGHKDCKIWQLYARENPINPKRGLLEILNDEVSDLILEKLNNKLNGQQEIGKTESKPRRPEKGLSKYYQNMFASTTKRQRCVTGQYPLKLTIQENPTRKWLSSGSSSAGTSQMLVNGTSIERSLASYDRFQWLDNDERVVLREKHALFSLELLAEIHVKKPGYVNILPASSAGFLAKKKREYSQIYKTNYRLTYNERFSDEDNSESSEIKVGMFSTSKQDMLERIIEAEKERLWITGFSLTKKSGELHYVDIESGSMGYINKETASAIRWPNEVNSVPLQKENLPSEYLHHTKLTHYDEDALLVSDGFLVPGRDNGGLYVILRPGHDNEYRSCLAGGNGVDRLLSKLENKKDSVDDQISTDEDGWFYHRSTWIDLTGDGRQSVLTARAKRPSILNKPGIAGQLDDSTMASLPTEAQLVWLERPLPYCYDEATGTPLDKDGLVFDPFSPKHTPWKTRVLQKGPDVMFSVADMDTTGKFDFYLNPFFPCKISFLCTYVQTILWRFLPVNFLIKN